MLYGAMVLYSIIYIVSPRRAERNFYEKETLIFTSRDNYGS